MCYLKMGFSILILGFGFTAPSFAQPAPTDKAQARAVFKEGQSALSNAEYERAVQFFERAYSLSKHPAMLLNIARVYEAVDDLKNAMKYFKKYRSENPKAKGMGKKIAELRATYASWPAAKITSVPPGLDVRVVDLSRPIIGQTPLRLRMQPGSHLVLVGSKENHAKETITFQQGTTPIVELTPAVAVAKAPVREAVPIPPKTSTTQGAQIALSVDVSGAQVRLDDILVGITPLANPISTTSGIHQLRIIGPGGDVHEEVLNLGLNETRELLVLINSSRNQPATSRLIALSSLGLGGAALVAGIASGLMALDANSKLKDCRASPCGGTPEEIGFVDDVRSRSQMTDILLGSGLALSATGAILLFQNTPVEDKEQEQEQNQQQVYRTINQQESDHWDTRNIWSSHR